MSPAAAASQRGVKSAVLISADEDQNYRQYVTVKSGLLGCGQ